MERMGMFYNTRRSRAVLMSRLLQFSEWTCKSSHPSTTLAPKPIHDNAPQDHSGSNSAQSLLSTQSNQDNSISVLRYMADQVKDKANIVGIELLNEPFGYSTSQLGPFCECSATGKWGLSGRG